MLNPTVRLAGGHISTASRSTPWSARFKPVSTASRSTPWSARYKPVNFGHRHLPQEHATMESSTTHPDPPDFDFERRFYFDFERQSTADKNCPAHWYSLIDVHFSRYSSSNVRVFRSSTSQTFENAKNSRKAGVLAKSELEY